MPLPDSPLGGKKISFRIAQKNNPEEIAISNTLEIVDIPFCFYRYKYRENTEFKDSVTVGQYIINEKNVSVIPFNKEGFLYIYYEKKANRDDFDYAYGAEYQLDVYRSDNKTYRTVLYTKIHHSSGNETQDLKWETAHPKSFINLNKGDLVWVAFSEVRWTNDFRERIMNDFEAVKKRFQCLDVSQFVEECQKPIALIPGYQNHYGKWGKYPQQSENSNIVYAYKKEQGLNRYVFVVAAATLFADDMSNVIKKANDDFEEYINKIISGINPETGEKCPDKDAYQALVMSASVLYPILKKMTNKAKSAKDDDSPINVIQEDKLLILLDLQNRFKKRESIANRIATILPFFNSDFFKYALLEYLNNTDANVVEGKSRMMGYYARMKDDPHLTDKHIYSAQSEQLLNYNAAKDNQTIAFSCAHYFYKDDNEKQKYSSIERTTLSYHDVNYEFDVIKLLLNTKVKEDKVFEDRPKNTTIADIYNLTAEVLEDDNQEIDLGTVLQKQVDIAIKLISTTDSIMWYYSNFVLTSLHYKQLEQQIDSFEELIKGLNLEKVNKVKSLEEHLAYIHDQFEERLNQHTQQVKQAKKQHGAALSQHQPTSVRKDKKKTQRVERAKEAYDKTTDAMDEVRLEKKGKLQPTEWDNRLIKKLDKNLTDGTIKKSQLRMNLDVYEQASHSSVRKIALSPTWIDLVYKMTIANVLVSIYVTHKEQEQGTRRNAYNAANMAVALTEFLAIVGDRYFEQHPELWKTFAERLKFKNLKMSFGLRLGFVGAVGQASIDLSNSYSNFAKGNAKAGSLYLVSSSTLLLATYLTWVSATAAKTATTTVAPAPYVGGALLLISIVSGIAASMLEYDEFEDFLASSVFGKGGLLPWESKRINTSTFNTSYKMGMELLTNKNKYSKHYTGLGFTNIDLSNFNQMFDVVRSLFTPIRCRLHASGKKVKGYENTLTEYNSFRLWVSYREGMFHEEKIEYEARLYRHGIHGAQGERNSYETISLVADKTEQQQDKLFRFATNLNLNDKSTSSSPCLMILVRICSLEDNAYSSTQYKFYPTPQNGEATYLGYKLNLIEVYAGYTYFSVNLQTKTISQLLDGTN